MIQTKEDLKEYIKADKLAFSSGRDSRIVERILKAIKLQQNEVFDY